VNKDPILKKTIKGHQQFVLATLIIWVIFSSFWRGMTLEGIWEYLLHQNGWGPESHKEIRFAIGALVILVITISVNMILVANLLTLTFARLIKKIPKIVVSIDEFKYWSNLLLVSFLLGLLLLQSFFIADARWHGEQFDDTNLAFTYVGHQENVTGIIAVAPWFQLGSYTYLHLGSEVIIEPVDFSNPDTFNYNKNFARNLITDWTEGNYLILPRYQLLHFGEILVWLLESNWQIDAVIDGRSEVWKRMT
jgi:hypothetical protein